MFKQTKSRKEIVNSRHRRSKSLNFQPDFNTDSDDDDDDDMMIRIGRKMQRSKTEIYDTNLSRKPRELLMDDPLRLFEEYDINQDGKLKMNEFENMLKALYPSILVDEI